MLIFDLQTMGNNLLTLRRQAGLTQEALAEAAELSPRTYADIERGAVNPRVESLLKICSALRITPNELLVSSADAPTPTIEQLSQRLQHCSPKQQQTALQLMDIYLSSL